MTDEDPGARSAPTGPPTIYDVARLAGVSPSTVSRALSRPGRLRAETEQRVRRTAEQVGFRPSASARALPTGRTMTLALLLAGITNPAVFGIVRGAERAASAAGYTLLVAESQQPGRTEQAIALQLTAGVDGVVLGTTRLDSPTIAGLARVKPTVLINREVDGVPGVVPDLDSGIGPLVAHLRSLGHVNVGYLAGPRASWSDRHRWSALLRLGRAAGLRPFEIPSAEAAPSGGAADLDRVLASPATAVVAFNDMMAIGLIRAARAAGVPIPGRLSVCGFDDIFASDLISPALTTVAAPLDDAAEHAVGLLLDVVHGSDAPERTRPTFETRLIVRDSTGPVATG